MYELVSQCMRSFYDWFSNVGVCASDIRDRTVRDIGEYRDGSQTFKITVHESEDTLHESSLLVTLVCII